MIKPLPLVLPQKMSVKIFTNNIKIFLVAKNSNFEMLGKKDIWNYIFKKTPGESGSYKLINNKSKKTNR